MMKRDNYMTRKTVDNTGESTGGWSVVCVAHDVISDLKKVEADALCAALNTEDARIASFVEPNYRKFSWFAG